MLISGFKKMVNKGTKTMIPKIKLSFCLFDNKIFFFTNGLNRPKTTIFGKNEADIHKKLAEIFSSVITFVATLFN